jgi:calcium-dependent protein kinase
MTKSLTNIDEPAPASNRLKPRKMGSSMTLAVINSSLSSVSSKAQQDDFFANKIPCFEERTISENVFSRRKPSLELTFTTLKPGQLTDMYKIYRIMSHKNYGKTSQVIHRVTGKQRILKSLKKQALTHSDKNILITNCHICSEFVHPNITKIIEMYEDEHEFHIISEFAVGEKIFDRILQNPLFCEKLAADYIKQILSALIYSHTRNIIHGGVHLNNLVFESPKAEAKLKLLNTGIPINSHIESNPGLKPYILYFTPPEILNGEEYSEKSDIWCTGVVLFIMLCGCPPFEGSNSHHIVQKIKYSEPEFPPEAWERMSDGAKILVKRMLVKDPKLRISTKDAIEETWLQFGNNRESFEKKYHNSLSAFTEKLKLLKLFFKYLQTYEPSYMIAAELEQFYQTKDTDKDFKLTRDEIIQGYITIFDGYTGAYAESQTLLSKMEADDPIRNDYRIFIQLSLANERTKILEEMRVNLENYQDTGGISKPFLISIADMISCDDIRWKAFKQRLKNHNDEIMTKETFLALFSE